MTEDQWLAATDPTPMLEFLRTSGRLSDRKARLFAVACCRRIWHLLTDDRSRRAVEVVEEYADGQTSGKILDDAIDYAEEAWDAIGEANALSHAAAYTALTVGKVWCVDAAQAAVWVTARDNANAAFNSARHGAERTAQTTLLRDIFGPLPFRPLTLSPSVRTWNDGCVLKLAAAAYEERALPEGTLDPQRLAVLADALEEAGCTNEEVLGHLRQPGLVHVRGCFPIDLVLGRK